MLVANPRKQKLYIQVKDSLGFADLTIGNAEVTNLFFTLMLFRFWNIYDSVVLPILIKGKLKLAKPCDISLSLHHITMSSHLYFSYVNVQT